MFEEKVSGRSGKKEVASWLDAKRIAPHKRDRYADQIETLEYAVIYGQVTFDSETRVIKHSLGFPIGDSAGVPVLSCLEYKLRLTTNDIQSRLKGISATDGGGVISAVICALTGQPSAMIGKLDTGR